ncbi:MAG: hypothetical protein WBH31_00430 [Promethearchaeia archaeon]
MNKRKIFLFILILLMIQLNQINNTDFVKANPTPVSTIGGILPKENLSLSLLNAEVKFEINALNFPNYLMWNFKSNYTIFNPDETINITIGMPFGWGTIIYNYSLTIDNNPALIYDTILLEYENPYYTNPISEVWNKYLENIDNVRKFYLFNITIPANNSVLICFSCESIERSVRGIIKDFGYLEIIYDVGTARVWNGNVTEKVEFKVYGRLPDYCYHEEDCKISDMDLLRVPILDKYCTKCFSWEWNNEIIEYNLVGIVYTSLPRNYLALISFSLLGLGIVIVAMIVIYDLKVKKGKKSLRL